MEEKLIPIGKIVKCQGNKGSVRLLPFIRDLTLNGYAGKIFTIDLSGKFQKRQVASIRPHKVFWIIHFERIDSAREAESLLGQKVAVHKTFFPKLSKGNFYWFEIVGLDVFDEENNFHGKVTRIFSTGSNDVYVVKKGLEEEFFLPATKEIVRQIDLKEKKIIIHLMEGLLE